ncbi:uncharacterized protein LOC142345536 [Convolutriloba macropyga]|uniref:uncharacterized protein LOC142345536 n=1 Tax=Convolutriloba macropyga TaxID=536237 RepID=UPI003F523688
MSDSDRAQSDEENNIAAPVQETEVTANREEVSPSSILLATTVTSNPLERLIETESDEDEDAASLVPDVFKCSICFEILLEPTTINCGHSFCRICLARWFEARKLARQSFICPECRKQWAAYPEVDYSLRDAMEIWYSDLLDARKRNLTNEDRSVLARFRAIGPATFAQFGGIGRPILNRRIPLNWRGMQFILALLMNAALILGIILLSLVVMLVAPGPDLDDELQKDESRIDISQWTVNDVDLWLDSLGPWMEPYRPAFREAKIDGSWLLILDEDLIGMGPLNVDNKLVARRLYYAIVELKNANNPKPPVVAKIDTIQHAPSLTEADASGDGQNGGSKSPSTVTVSRQKIFVLILGLLHFPRTITLMSYFVIDFQPITEFLNSVNVIQKEKFEDELPEVSWWIAARFIVLPQFTIVFEAVRSGGQIEGFVRLLVIILLIRMCEELKLYFTSFRLLYARRYGELYKLWIGEFCRFGRDFSMVVAMGYLHTVLPSALIDVYFCYIVCYPALAFMYSVARVLYRRVPFFRNVGILFVQSMERGLNIVVTYLLRVVFGWLIPQIIRLVEPAFRQAAAEGRQPPQQPRPNAGPQRVPVPAGDEGGRAFLNLLAVDIDQNGARMRGFQQNMAQNDIPVD